MLPEIRRRALAVPPGFGVGLHPVLRRAYAARGLTTDADLDLSLSRLLPVGSLAGVEAAAELLAAHRRSGRVLVVGDFDADGATSSALVVRALRALGFAQLDGLFRAGNAALHGSEMAFCGLQVGMGAHGRVMTMHRAGGSVVFFMLVLCLGHVGLRGAGQQGQTAAREQRARYSGGRVKQGSARQHGIYYTGRVFIAGAPAPCRSFPGAWEYSSG